MKGYLGIDVSKGYADFMLLDGDRNALEAVFQLDDTRQGHQALKDILHRYLDGQLEMVCCGVESTGGFENNWYTALLALGRCMNVQVARLNPSGVKKNAEAGLRRNITDALSARYIAEYLIGQPDKVRYEGQSSYYASFRSINGHIKLQVKQQTQLVNQLKMLLYSGFPELVCYCRSGIPYWVLAVLARYPLATDITKAGKGRLAKIPHLTPERAEALLAKAGKSVASRTHAAQGFLIKSLARQLMGKQELITEHKQYMEQQCTGKEIDLLDSMPGIGPYSAAAIMVEIEDVKRFATPKHLASYFGLHPEPKESGDKAGQSRMSKKGRASVRALLYMCAQAAVRCDGHLKGIYHNHRAKGKNHRQAIGAVMHKMLRMIHGILSSGKAFSSETDKVNRDKKTTAEQQDKTVRETKTKRRYQGMETEAPVSGRQSRKRKVHIGPQADDVGQERGHLHAPA